MEKTRSWKIRHGIGKNEVGKIRLKLESFQLTWKERRSILFNFSCTIRFQPELSNFSSNSPTSAGFFQLRCDLSNFGPKFQTSIFPILIRAFHLLVFSNCPFQLNVSHLTVPPYSFFDLQSSFLFGTLNFVLLLSRESSFIIQPCSTYTV